MEKKKTPKQRIIDSLLFIEKDDKTLNIDFKDKGLKIEITSEYAIISTTFHKHIFDAITSNQYNTPYLFIKQFVEIALNLNLKKKLDDGTEYYSYAELAKYIKSDKANKEDVIIFSYCDMWLFNINQPLNTLQSDEISSFIVYMNYISNLANVSILLNEAKKDVTNKKYIELYINTIKEFTKDIEERVVFKGLSDDEIESGAIDEYTKLL